MIFEKRKDFFKRECRRERREKNFAKGFCVLNKVTV